LIQISISLRDQHLLLQPFSLAADQIPQVLQRRLGQITPCGLAAKLAIIEVAIAITAKSKSPKR